MVQTLRLGFLDTYENAIKFFLDILGQRYRIIRDDDNPEVLIFGDPNFGFNYLNPKYDKCTKVLFTGENFRPSYYKHKFAITFDHVNSPFHYRLPLYVTELWAIGEDQGIFSDYLWRGRPESDFEKAYDSKSKMIAYIQRNPNCQFRTHMVQKMNSLGILSSGGPHLNNVGYLVGKSRDHKFAFFSQAFFGMAFENGSYPGYVTEKLIDCYYSLTIPLYWGSPTISRDFDPKSMILLDEKDDLRELSSLAQDKNKYLDILSRPVFPNNIPNQFVDLDKFLNWFSTFVVPNV